MADGTRTAAEALAQQIGTGIELYGRRKDGSRFPIEIMLSPLEIAGEILVTAAIRNITKRKESEKHLERMEAEYRAERERAQKAREEKARLQMIAMEQAREEKTRLQERFLSHVSHELRTPLTAIYFFTTNLLDGICGDLTAEQHKQGEMALTNICQLKEMVNDLLDITRIEAHKFTLRFQRESASKLITDVLSTCQTNAVAKGIILRSDTADGTPFVWADAARVRQILTNLIDNGIKFTPEGGTVVVGSRSLSKDDGFLCLSVSDTGCGINPENLEIVFDRLAQLDNGEETSRNGLGLGLFITKELVSLHGGRIWVESELQRGSAFFFTLPRFALARFCAHIFTETNLEAGNVTLIAVETVTVEAAVQEDTRQAVRSVLSRCIHPAQDVLLPTATEAAPREIQFIVAFTDGSGSVVIANRIARELQNFDSASRLKPVISCTTLLVVKGSSREVQTREVTRQIERLVQTHLGLESAMARGGNLSVPTSAGGAVSPKSP